MLSHMYDVVVIGGGAAGVGVTVALKHAGIENCVILERHAIGASFALWSNETRFITPSFPTNSIGMLDLNAIALGTSPAYSLRSEHPTGKAYALYLNAVAKIYELPVKTNTYVTDIACVDGTFHIETLDETIRAKHVIWAAGEFQYPRLNGVGGSRLCQHTALIPSFDELEGEHFIVIGGYESGIDAAYHLACRGKKVMLFDEGCPWQMDTSDPSKTLSTYSFERMRDERFVKHVELYEHTRIKQVKKTDGGYEVITLNNQQFSSPVTPLLATGFEGSHRQIRHLFEQRPDGYPQLNQNDESTLTPGLFLCGPAVRHDDHVFCFIYKYRQRFAVVAKTIATSQGLGAEDLEEYRKWGMYLDDLSCCGEECVC